MNGLLLHCGATIKSLEEITAVQTPEETETWKPVAHMELIQMVKDEASAHGFEVETEEYGMADGALYDYSGGKKNKVVIPNAKMFGVMTAKDTRDEGGNALMFGVRNFHDKSGRAGAFAGGHMFVCDNLIVSAEIQIMQKHCPRTMEELASNIADGMAKLPQFHKKQQAQVESYRVTKMTDRDFHDVVCKAQMAGFMPANKIGKVLEQWYEPNHDIFKERNVWSGLNAFTEVAKETPVFTLPERMQGVNKLCDELVYA